jgi:hypothetical protein
MTDAPKIIRSPLSQAFTRDGITVQVNIYKLQGGGWSLEVVDEEGGSAVCEELFATDAAAFFEFTEGVDELGLARLIEPDGDNLSTVH